MQSTLSSNQIHTFVVLWKRRQRCWTWSMHDDDWWLMTDDDDWFMMMTATTMTVVTVGAWTIYHWMGSAHGACRVSRVAAGSVDMMSYTSDYYPPCLCKGHTAYNNNNDSFCHRWHGQFSVKRRCCCHGPPRRNDASNELWIVDYWPSSRHSLLYQVRRISFIR